MPNKIKPPESVSETPPKARIDHFLVRASLLKMTGANIHKVAQILTVYLAASVIKTPADWRAWEQSERDLRAFVYGEGSLL